MLRKTKRLTTAAFDQYFKAGKRYHSPHFTVVYTPTKDFHAAVVVGKKVSKKAVDRNRLRRQIYSRLYTLHQNGQLEGTLIVLTKPSATTLGKSLTEAISSIITGIPRTHR